MLRTHRRSTRLERGQAFGARRLQWSAMADGFQIEFSRNFKPHFSRIFPTFILSFSFPCYFHEISNQISGSHCLLYKYIDLKSNSHSRCRALAQSTMYPNRMSRSASEPASSNIYSGIVVYDQNWQFLSRDIIFRYIDNDDNIHTLS